MGQTMHLTAADGFVCPAYRADPPPGTPLRGAVLVLQEIFGVNPHIRAVADGYARAGYLALAPATFARLTPQAETAKGQDAAFGVVLGYGPDDIARGRELKAAAETLPAPGLWPDLQAACDWLAATSAARVGVVGYCWGGLLAWRAAAHLQGLSAAVCYYGGGMTVAPEVDRAPRVPVLAHFGERDPLIPMDTVAAFRAAQPAVQVAVYPSDHGFNCDQRGSFDATAAALARERSLTFFAQHLGG